MTAYLDTAYVGLTPDVFHALPLETRDELTAWWDSLGEGPFTDIVGLFVVEDGSVRVHRLLVDDEGKHRIAVDRPDMLAMEIITVTPAALPECWPRTERV